MADTSNAAVFDVHIELALQNGWYLYGDTTNVDAKNNFRSLWGPAVDTAMLDRWFTELGRRKPTFNPAKQPRTAQSDNPNKLPMVIVELDDETLEMDFVGRVGYVDSDTGKHVEAEFHTQRVVITILTRSPTLTRSLYVIFRATMVLAEKAFIEEGYTDIHFVNGGPLEPEEELLAEEQGVFCRRQVWECRAQLTFIPTEASSPAKGWFVATDNVVVDGYKGGVKTSSTWE